MSDKKTMPSSGPENYLDIPPAFSPIKDLAIARFSYLYPDIQITLSGDRAVFRSDREEIPARVLAEFRYLLYRERIYQEALPIRRRIYERLLG